MGENLFIDYIFSFLKLSGGIVISGWFAGLAFSFMRPSWGHESVVARIICVLHWIFYPFAWFRKTAVEDNYAFGLIVVAIFFGVVLGFWLIPCGFAVVIALRFIARGIAEAYSPYASRMAYYEHSGAENDLEEMVESILRSGHVASLDGRGYVQLWCTQRRNEAKAVEYLLQKNK